MTKKMVSSIALSGCMFVAMAFSLSAMETSNPITHSQSVQTNTSQLRADDIRWVYEVRDGHIWKCLFNFTRGEWVGDWIKC